MKLGLLVGMLAACYAAAAPDGAGAFYPFNGGVEGRIGDSRLAVSAWEGGALELRDAAGAALCRGAWVCRVAGPDGREREVRQEWDRSPEIRFLEEGHLRIGVRALFRLYDAAGVYHGHGMTEAWAYADGQVFVTACAMFEDGSAHTGVVAAAWEIEAGGGPAAPVEVSGTNAPADRLVWTGSAGTGGFAMYWRPGWTMDHRNFVARPEGGSPTYYRWPSFLNQAYYGFGPPRRLAPAGAGRTRLEWDTAKTAGKPAAAFGAVYRLTAFPARAAAFAEADRRPVSLSVTGGVIHVTARAGGPGYNDQEGAYEVRKAGEVLRVELPPDPAGRTVRIKVVGLGGHAGVDARLDGKPVLPQLAGDGGIADDPLAPIREQPEGPADMALIEAALGPRPRVLEVRETAGVQLTYQNRDAWRSYCLFSDRTGPRWAGFRFSPVDGRIRAMRKNGHREYALGENLMTWFIFCGYTPLQIADQLESFRIVENGPERVVFRYASVNANGRARSEYEVTVPAGAPANLIQVKAVFTVLDSWPYSNVQFFDVFPFRGVDPREWWYDEVLWVAPDGRSKWMRTLERTQEGEKELETFAGGGFFALHAADRGNMVMLTKNFKPDLPVKHVICGNYVDFHMAVQFRDEAGKAAPPPAGTRVEMEYELAVWGDASVTREALTEMGRRSLKAGRLVLE